MLASIACSITERPSPRIFLAKSYDIMCSTKLALQQRVPRICLTSWFVPLPSPLVCSLLKQTISLSFSLFVLFLMEHLHSLASMTQHNLAVKSRQIREIPENKKTLGPQEMNADYILLQSAIDISVFLTSSPVHSWRPELSQMHMLIFAQLLIYLSVNLQCFTDFPQSSTPPHASTPLSSSLSHWQALRCTNGDLSFPKCIQIWISAETRIFTATAT